MRITNRMLSNTFLSDMKNNLENIKKLQEQMTSGKEIRRPSDDPLRVARAMNLHTDIAENKQYNENISDTINWLDTTDTALGQVGDVFHRVRELLISAGNGGYSSSERRAIKDEINEKIGEVSQILNTNFDGMYIFGGTRGTTKPVDVVGGSSLGNSAVTNKIVIDKSKTPIAGTIVNEKGELKSQLKFTIKYDKFKTKPDGTLDTATEEKKMDITFPTTPHPTTIQSLSDLAEKINKQIVGNEEFKDKIKAVPNIKDGTIMFVNINENDNTIKDNTFKIDSVGDVSIGKDTSTPNINNTENTRLMYYKKGGGELVDGDEYSQIQKNLTVQISQGVKMDYNVSATDVLEFTNEKGEKLDIREIFKNIANHLDGKDDAGTIVDDSAIKELVNGDLQKLTDAMNNVLKIRSEVGAKQNRMESAHEKNTDANFNMTEILSKTEDIDITEKTMEFAVMQTVYLASLQTSARVIQPSLLDYLR
ncbi:flagellar hook-associated protein FlgL [Clostridium sp. MB40-C1]|uniref:flagellar hook-associated protein FlgL n=1 Tax=Clostridium sp. MB40-C1 TaxID=3070996 RepID=UPI0027E09F73|nr:flagellar hook-associated protein FlgL [Clostridium sp. MB40-C1]WMJ81302.1 flagellar hook-associated protein FlgL [Clostridium sp. MB40-C1]